MKSSNASGRSNGKASKGKGGGGGGSSSSLGLAETHLQSLESSLMTSPQDRLNGNSGNSNSTARSTATAAAIAYSRALRERANGKSTSAFTSSSSTYTGIASPDDEVNGVTRSPLYGQYPSTRIAADAYSSTLLIQPSTTGHISSSSKVQQQPIYASHYETLDRSSIESSSSSSNSHSGSGGGSKLSNLPALRSNNLLSSSVRDLLTSTLRNSDPHSSIVNSSNNAPSGVLPSSHLIQSIGPRSTVIRSSFDHEVPSGHRVTSNDQSIRTYATLIDSSARTSNNSCGTTATTTLGQRESSNTYDSTSGTNAVNSNVPTTTCLVRTQSGSRFIFPAELAENPLQSTLDHSLIMRTAPGANSATHVTPSGPPGSTSTGHRGTFGKIGRSNSSSFGLSSTFQSRFSKNWFTSTGPLGVRTRNSPVKLWRTIALILLILCLILFFSLMYTINLYRALAECTCSTLMIDDPADVNSLNGASSSGDSRAIMSSSASSSSSPSSSSPNSYLNHKSNNQAGHSYFNSNSNSNGHRSTNQQQHQLLDNSSPNLVPVNSNSNCPILCSGRGTYLQGSCQCSNGWKGKECNIPEDECELTNCSGHGDCISGECNCYPGFTGVNCELESCPIFCSGHGRYIKGSCHCSPGWKGKECELRKDQCESPNCSGHGLCVEGDCVCKPGWKGPSCNVSTSQCEVPNCNGHGQCINGICQCDAKYKGIHCEISDCLDSTCSGHGVCFEAKCICKPGWRGENCSQIDDRLSKFFPNCSGHGVYDIEAEKCSCFSGWSGENCSLAKCKLDCGTHGTCEGSSCTCYKGWTGPRCDQKLCDSRCSSHGSCLNGTCICSPGYYGKHCTLNGCPSNCTGHGQCIRANSFSLMSTSSSTLSSSSSSSSSTATEGEASGSNYNSNNINGLGDSTLEGWRCMCHDGWTGLDCSHPLEANCADDTDNDNDGLVDCADSECCGHSACRDSLMCLTSPEPLDILLRKPPPSVTASFYQKMKFLIDEGSVQSYAHRDEYSESQFWSAFKPSRVSVIRGRVVTPDANGLTGIRISVATDPQFGFTLTRPDGWFDILVNGGSMVTLQFQRSPFHPIKRTVLVPWNEIVVIQSPIVMAAGADSAPITDQLIHSTSSEVSSLLSTLLVSPDPFLVKYPRHSTANSTAVDSPTGTETFIATCFDHNYDLMKPLLIERESSGEAGTATQESAGISETQSLVESLTIPSSSGVKLTYRSSLAPGYMSVLHLQLTPSKIPLTLKLIHLRIVVEGNLFGKVFEPDSNIKYTYSWNKRNVYRQKVYGLTTAKVYVGYEYNSCSQVIWSTLTTTMKGFDMEISELGTWNLDVHHRYNFHQGILQKGDGSSVYYKYQSRVAATLIGSSDKSRRSLNCPPSECDGPASAAKLLAPISLAPGPDGSLYIGDGNLIRRITPEGYVYTVFKISSSESSKSTLSITSTSSSSSSLPSSSSSSSSSNSRSSGSNSGGNSQLKSSLPVSLPLLLPGTSSSGLSNLAKSTAININGGNANNAFGSTYALNYHLTLSPLDHHVYISDPERHQILRIHTVDQVIDPEANYDVFIGSGQRCLPKDLNECGDGSSAIDAKLTFPKGMAFTFDGSLYFADGDSIRMVNKKGIINTVIGSNGLANGGKAKQWKPIPCTGTIELSQVTLRWPTEVAVHPIDGTIYFLDDSMVLKILPDGRLMVAAGLPSHCRGSQGWSSGGGGGGRSGQGSAASGSSSNSQHQSREGKGSPSGGLNSKKDRSNHRTSGTGGRSRGNSNQLNDSDAGSERAQEVTEDEEVEDQLHQVPNANGDRRSNGSRSGSRKSPAGGQRKNIDIGLVVSFAFSSNGDLFVGTVDNSGMHRVYLLRETRSMASSSLVKQEVVHFFGSNKGHLPALTSMAICEVETCRDVDARNCSCALASREMISSFGNSGHGASKVQVQLASETPLESITAIAITSDGIIHVADESSGKVISAVPFVPGPDENLLFSMTSPGSNELYIFNKYGQHVFTKNSVTGQVLYSFMYDSDTSLGKLSAITDIRGSRVSFLRDSSRNLIAIETTTGSKCKVSVNSQGLLESFIDPDNLTTRFFYDSSSGLMTTRRDSSGFNLFYKYDPNGRLVGVIADSF